MYHIQQKGVKVSKIVINKNNRIINLNHPSLSLDQISSQYEFQF